MNIIMIILSIICIVLWLFALFTWLKLIRLDKSHIISGLWLPIMLICYIYLFVYNFNLL